MYKAFLLSPPVQYAEACSGQDSSSKSFSSFRICFVCSTDIAANFAIFAIAVPTADTRNRYSPFGDKTKQCHIAIQGCDGQSLWICDFKLVSTPQSLAIAIVRFWCAERIIRDFTHV